MTDDPHELPLLHVRPGDVLVIRLMGVLSPSGRDRLQAHVRELFPGNKALILEAGASFGVLRPTSAA